MGLKERAFVKNRIGQKIFLTFLLIVAVPLIAISLLSREISEYVLEKATDQLLRDSTKAIGLNLLDRIRSAEALLKIQAVAAENRQPNPAGDARASLVFSEIRKGPAKTATAGSGSFVRVVHRNNAVLEDVEIEIVDGQKGTSVIGVLDSDYLWENLESAFYSLCVSGAEFRVPHCYGPRTEEPLGVRNERPLFFRPYLEGRPWTLTAIASPDIADYLPVKLGEIFAYVAVFSLLMALSVSAVFIRRATTPLDAIIAATDAVKSGDFSHEVPVKGMKDEYREVALSFNTMSKAIGADIAFMQTLGAMDEAILARRPFEDTLLIGLEFLARSSTGHAFEIGLADSDGRRHRIFRIANGALSQERRDDTGIDFVDHDIPGLIARSDVRAVVWREDSGPHPSPNHAAKIAAIKSRIAMAVDSEGHESSLVARAARDSLTRLLNRLGIVDRLGELVANMATNQRRLAVVYLDLDGFKEVNDAYGHDTGDRLLKLVADRLSASLSRKELALARMGGDEFVFIIPADAEDFYKRSIASVLADLQPAFKVEGLQIEIGASLGVSLCPDHGLTHIDLLKCADLAMYSAKARGRNQIVYFEPSLNTASVERIELRRDLNLALARQQLYVVYQPRVRCDDLRHQSAEALLRWQHPEKGNISPDRFIQLAEESGQILEIGYWVLTEAACQIRAWRAQSLGSIETISVNLSPVQLMNESFIERVSTIMRDCDVPPSFIELEITEGALIKDIDDAVRKLNQLRALGFSIALDDFGVGYSAMTYLSVLPFDTLKIDKSFVNGLGRQESAYAIASAIVALGKALGKEIVAEGVETAEQAAVLTALGVDELQGYLYSRPVRPRELEMLLAT